MVTAFTSDDKAIVRTTVANYTLTSEADTTTMGTTTSTTDLAMTTTRKPTTMTTGLQTIAINATMTATKEIIVKVRVDGVDFSVESARQTFERTVCRLFENQQGCSVAFKSEVEVTLSFADVETAREETQMLKNTDFDKRLVFALKRTDPDDADADSSAFENVAVTAVSMSYVQEPDKGSASLSSDKLTEEIDIILDGETVQLPAAALAATLAITTIVVLATILVTSVSVISVQRCPCDKETFELTAGRSKKVPVFEEHPHSPENWLDESKSSRKVRRDTYSSPQPSFENLRNSSMLSAIHSS